MTDTDDDIPTIGEHRGVPIHDQQSPARIKVVKAAIDAVYRMADMTVLFAYAKDMSNPPEARLFAADKCRAVWEQATDDRRVRPKVPLKLINAVVAGLDSQAYRDYGFYCSILEAHPQGQPGGPVRRETPIKPPIPD